VTRNEWFAFWKKSRVASPAIDDRIPPPPPLLDKNAAPCAPPSFACRDSLCPDESSFRITILAARASWPPDLINAGKAIKAS